MLPALCVQSDRYATEGVLVSSLEAERRKRFDEKMLAAKKQKIPLKQKARREIARLWAQFKLIFSKQSFR